MKIKVNQITLNYTKIGEGAPLILLHGNGEDYHIFDPLILKLKQDFTIYAIDSRNHGESTLTEDYSYGAMAQDISLFIEMLELKNPSILGFSDGAILCLMLAMDKKIEFSHMILLGVNLKPTDFKQEIYQQIVDEYANTKDPLMKMMLEEPNIEMSGLKALNIRTLVVRAEDELFNNELYDGIVKTMPNAELKVMKGHNHGSYLINQDVLYADLMSFIDF